ncbi:MAG: S8 family peptidase [Bacteroidales bacterium]|nr:S8 family peptidase [Bacteroidales bacterium]
MRRHLLLLLSLLACQIGFAQNYNVIEPELQNVLDSKSNDMISVNIILKSEANISHLRKNIQSTEDAKAQRQVVVSELKNFSEQSQKDILSLLKAGEASGDVKDITAHWLSNMITCTASKDYIYLLSEHYDIKIIGYNETQFLLWNEKAREVEAQRGMTQNIKHVNANKAWNEGYTGKGVLVGVIDTGVNFHKDLEKNLWDGGEEYPNHGYNTFENSHDVHDGFNHGTHCAGIICGDGTSGTQTGIAPDATVMCIKVMDDAGGGNANTVCSGIEFAIEHGADVLNMSLGFPNASMSTREALRQTYENALEANVAIMTAVGNDGMLNLTFPVPNSVRVPGGCPPPWLHPDQQANPGGLSACIAVSAVNYYNVVADFSSRGPFTWQTSSYEDYPYLPGREIGLIRPDVCAPGVGIISCSNTNSSGYISMDGTSQATPCVTGVVCLMLQKKPYLTPAQICEALETTATKLSETKSNETGSGCVNAMLALEEIEDYKDITGIEDKFTNNVSIYPNPVKDRLYIETESEIEEVIVYDIYGRHQVTETPSHQEMISIDISNLNSGVYFVKINTANGNIVKRFVKE